LLSKELPTQISLGEGNGSYANLLRKSIPFYDEMISMIPMGKGRTSIPEYPAIAEDIRQALDDVYYGIKDLSINKTDSILKVDKLHTEGPLDYMFTNFEYTNVITESVICGDMYYMVR
jgi:hypothetical protein